MTNPPRRTKRTAAKPKETGFNQRELFAVAKKLKIPIGQEGGAQALPPSKPPRNPPEEPDHEVAAKKGPASKKSTEEKDATHGSGQSAGNETRAKPIESRLSVALGPPSLLPGEDAAAYGLIEAEFFDIITPRNIVEQTWVRELTDGVWEERRLSLAKGVSIKLGRREGVQATVEAVVGPRGIFSVSSRPSGAQTSIEMMHGNAEATKTFSDCAQRIGLNPEEHLTAIYVARMSEQMRIQDAIDKVRRNRTRLLRDVEKRRDDMAKLAKTASERLLEARDDTHAQPQDEPEVADG